MRLVWHIIWKDVKRLWLPLALWGAVIVAQHGVWQAEGGVVGVGGNKGVSELVTVLWALHLAIAWLLVPLVLQDEPLLDDRAAWRVRPISGARLLAAKLGGMAVMLWLWPSLLTVPWWIEFGFGPDEIARAVVINMIGMALLTGPALMVAVLTEGYARFLAWSLALGMAVSLGAVMLAAGLDAADRGEVGAAALLTRAWLAGALGWGTAAVVVVWQFLTRRIWWARGLVAAMVVTIGLIVQLWPWSGLQVRAKMGLGSLPTVKARMGNAALIMPSGEAERSASVKVTAEFEVNDLAGDQLPIWNFADPTIRFGERRLTVAWPIWMGESFRNREVAAALARGRAVRHDLKDQGTWDMNFSSVLSPQVRNGQTAISVRYPGAVWRGELGPVVPLRVGAGGGRGWQQIHVNTVQRGRDNREWADRGSVGWWQTGPLFEPAALLEMINPEGLSRSRYRAALWLVGHSERLDAWPTGEHRTEGPDFLRGRTPVGLVSVASLTSTFDRYWRDYSEIDSTEVIDDRAMLASVTFQVAAPLRVVQTETPLLPDFFVEGRMDDALRRAKTEEKLVLARLSGKDTDQAHDMPDWWNVRELRALLVANFICVQVTGEEAARLRKRSDEPGGRFLVVLKANGEEQDRLNDLGGASLIAALRANLAGKTWAATLMETLAAKGGDDRKLRFEVHTALRARGELAGALDAIMWMVDHPSEPAESREILQVGWRLQRFVATYGSARDALLERRERAIVALRHDPRDAGAARLLFAITLGLRHDTAIWREFPRLLSRENPSSWDYQRYWIRATVSDRRFRDVIEAVDLEKFFAAGPAWVRQQLLGKRVLPGAEAPASVAEWQRSLVLVGASCVEALAGAGQRERALRFAAEVRRIDGSRATIDALADALWRVGAVAESEQLRAEKTYGR